jgi:hypothetical protein
MSKNNKLSFELYSDAETKLVSVVCVEGIGTLATFSPAYEEFEKA